MAAGTTPTRPVACFCPPPLRQGYRHLHLARAAVLEQMDRQVGQGSGGNGRHDGDMTRVRNKLVSPLHLPLTPPPPPTHLREHLPAVPGRFLTPSRLLGPFLVSAKPSSGPGLSGTSEELRPPFPLRRMRAAREPPVGVRTRRRAGWKIGYQSQRDDPCEEPSDVSQSAT